MTATDKAQANRATAAKVTYPEIEFSRFSYIPSGYQGLDTPGIWVYTEAEHPRAINTFPFEKNDLLLVQLPTSRYKDHYVEIIALQKIAPNVVRIVCDISSAVPNLAGQYYSAWLEYAYVPKGALANMRFVLVDKSLQEIAMD